MKNETVKDHSKEITKDPRVCFTISLFNNEKELEYVIAKEKNRVRNMYEGFVLLTEIDYCFMRIIIYYVRIDKRERCLRCGKKIEKGYDIYAYETNEDKLCQNCFYGQHECSPAEYRRDSQIVGMVVMKDSRYVF